MSDEAKDRLIGQIIFEFTEDADGDWYSEISPEFKTEDLKEIYKLALITAVLQDTCKRRLAALDHLMRVKDVAKEQTTSDRSHRAWQAAASKEELQATLADVDKYQTKLPFEDPPDEAA